MQGFRITGFAGVVPRRGARLLEPNQAQIAVNCRLTSGYIGPLYEPDLVASPAVTGIQSIYRLRDGALDRWLAWDRDVDAVKSPIAGDESQRVYYTGDNEPRVTDLALATAGGTPFPKDFYVLGVYPPKTAPSLTHAGGTGAAVSRSVVYTFVTAWGEESQPSPASAVVTGKVDGTWTIGATTAMNVAPLNVFTVTGASWAGGIATLTVALTFGLRVGEEIIVAGINPAGYNTTSSLITAVTATTVSYAVAVDPGAYVANGTITRGAPHNTTGMMKRIYWLEGGTFFFVKEVTAATTDTTVDGNATAGEELPSTDWEMPPADMRGLVLHPSGAVIGFSKNEIFPSEPYKPYAFPASYRHSFDFSVVGLGIFGSTVVVATEGQPYLVTGVEPAGFAPQKLDHPWPCVAKRGIVNMGFGVAYPTTQGLALIGLGGADLVTKEFYTQEEWLKLAPSTFVSAQYAGRYVASFTIDGVRQVLIIDKSEFASIITANKQVTSMWGDLSTGELFVVIGNSIYEWDADDGVPMTADWLSGEKVFAKPVNLGAAKVDADFTMSPEESVAAQAANAAVIALNQALINALATAGSINAYSVNELSLNGSKLKPLPSVIWESLTFQLYVDGTLKFSKTLVSEKAFVMPSGYKANNAAVRVSGNVIVKSISVAETMKGLEQV